MANVRGKIVLSCTDIRKKVKTMQHRRLYVVNTSNFCIILVKLAFGGVKRTEFHEMFYDSKYFKKKKIHHLQSITLEKSLSQKTQGTVFKAMLIEYVDCDLMQTILSTSLLNTHKEMK